MFPFQTRIVLFQTILFPFLETIPKKPNTLVLSKPFRNGFLLIHPNHLSDGMEPSTKQEETRLFTIARWFACLIKQQGRMESNQPINSDKPEETISKPERVGESERCWMVVLFRFVSIQTNQKNKPSKTRQSGSLPLAKAPLADWSDE